MDLRGQQVPQAQREVTEPLGQQVPQEPQEAMEVRVQRARPVLLVPEPLV